MAYFQDTNKKIHDRGPVVFWGKPNPEVPDQWLVWREDAYQQDTVPTRYMRYDKDNVRIAFSMYEVHPLAMPLRAQLLCAECDEPIMVFDYLCTHCRQRENNVHRSMSSM